MSCRSVSASCPAAADVMGHCHEAEQARAALLHRHVLDPRASGHSLADAQGGMEVESAARPHGAAEAAPAAGSRRAADARPGQGRRSVLSADKGNDGSEAGPRTRLRWGPCAVQRGMEGARRLSESKARTRSLRGQSSRAGDQGRNRRSQASSALQRIERGNRAVGTRRAIPDWRGRGEGTRGRSGSRL